MKGAGEANCYYPRYLGFLSLLLLPSRLALLGLLGDSLRPRSEFCLEREPVFHWPDSSLRSFGRRLPGERDIILGTWLPCLISFQKD